MTPPHFPFPEAGDPPWGLFLDLDGTLAEIADHPDRVHIPAVVPTLLSRLQLQLKGAVAVVSGRSLNSVDRLIAMPYLDAAGCHGGEFRIGGCSITSVHLVAELGDIARKLSRLAEAIGGVFIERKPRSIAFHYRLSELSSHDAHALVTMATEDHGKLFRIIMGHRVVEILPAGAGKGIAIAKFMEHAPYLGRRPVFVGDDLTDEEGFDVVNRRDGLSIHVGGSRATHARWRLESPSSVLGWLTEVLGVLEKESVQK